MILVQHGVGECAELLRLSDRSHRAYCRQHGARFVQDFSRRSEDRPPHWEKIQLLLKVCGESKDGEIIVWLDADALILEHKITFENVLQTPNFGLTRVKYVNHPLFYNTGMIIMRNGGEVRDVLAAAWDAWPNPVAENEHPKHDEKALNQIFTERNIAVQELSAEWNSWHKNEAEKPIVKAWHGVPEQTVRRRMAECLRQHS